jgi:hypothetical protein
MFFFSIDVSYVVLLFFSHPLSPFSQAGWSFYYFFFIQAHGIDSSLSLHLPLHHNNHSPVFRELLLLQACSTSSDVTMQLTLCVTIFHHNHKMAVITHTRIYQVEDRRAVLKKKQKRGGPGHAKRTPRGSRIGGGNKQKQQIMNVCDYS